MRVEPHTIDSIVHITKRGSRGLPIVKDLADKERFKRLLFYTNDAYRDEYWERTTKDLDMFERPAEWPARKPWVKILAWSLMPNHFHLVLKEIKSGGIAKFMQKLGGSMTTHFNAKYAERGSIFQGSYKGRTVELHGDEYLRLLAVYVMVKNPFELYKGGLKNAIEHFEEAYEWASSYPFCSLGDYVGAKSTPVIEKDIFGELFPNSAAFKAWAQESLQFKLDQILQFDKMDKSDLSKLYVIK